MTVEAGRLLVDEIVPRITAVVARSVKLVDSEDVEDRRPVASVAISA